MTRDELIEAMARAIKATGERVAFPKLFATAAISAIEAAGFAIVPVVASEGMGEAGTKPIAYDAFGLRMQRLEYLRLSHIVEVLCAEATSLKNAMEELK